MGRIDLEKYNNSRLEIELMKEIDDFIYEIGVKKAGFIGIYDAFKLVNYHAMIFGSRVYNLPIDQELIMYYDDLKKCKYKICTTCKRRLHRSNFTKNLKAKDNKDYNCSGCKKIKREEKNGR